MTCGIYQLTFKSGNTYIGKSIDIEARWKQHQEAMYCGTAAKLLQAEYSTYGIPSASVLLVCHKDHIDLLEECLIARLDPKLNTVKLPDRLPGITGDDFSKLVEQLQYSTVEHISIINTLSTLVNNNENDLEDLNNVVAVLEKKRSEEELSHDTLNRIKIAENQAKTISDEFKKLKKEYNLYKNKPWYFRLFN